jgi:hypothetical protein
MSDADRHQESGAKTPAEPAPAQTVTKPPPPGTGSEGAREQHGAQPEPPGGPER